MSNSILLIVGAQILYSGTPLQDTDDALIYSDITFQKSTIPGYQLINAAIPSDFSTWDYEWIAGHLQKKNTPGPEPDANANALIIQDSFHSSLRRKAALLQQQGKSFEAVQLLLQAQGIQS